MLCNSGIQAQQYVHRLDNLEALDSEDDYSPATPTQSCSASLASDPLLSSSPLPPPPPIASPPPAPTTSSAKRRKRGEVSSFQEKEEALTLQILRQKLMNEQLHAKILELQLQNLQKE